MSGETIEETICIGGRQLVITRPRRPEDLIDERDFAEDEFLPYWAELWPSALALAEVVAARDLPGDRVVELGCGLGVPALAAAVRGAGVLATDWSAEAVGAAAANAARNGLDVATAVWRWTDDARVLRPPFDLVLGSDLLYERRNGPWLAAALEALLAPGSEAWIADPGRATAAEFFDRVGERFAVEPIDGFGPRPVTVHRLVRR